MSRLRPVARRGGDCLYAVEGPQLPGLTRYVASSPAGRRICDRPEVLGIEFSRHLRQAVGGALALLPELELIRAAPEESVCVVHFLRGGLSFSLREALHDVAGLVSQGSCFLSSQRRQVGDRWEVVEDSYRKLRVPDRASLLVGDVVATGITAVHGLEAVAKEFDGSRSVPRRLVFFTVGCQEVERLLSDWNQRWAGRTGYEGSTVVYLEGRFGLESMNGTLPLGLPGTDLLRGGALIAPELFLSQYDLPTIPLERCVIYDAGSRAFDVPTFRDEVRSYWRGVKSLAEQGVGLDDFRQQRWPEPWRGDAGAFLRWAAERWQELDAELEARLVEVATGAAMKSAGQDAAALAEIASSRIAAFS